MNAIEVGSFDFKLLVQCISKRPEEYAERLIGLNSKMEGLKLLETRFDHVMAIVEELYDSGDYSANTEVLLRKILLEC